MDLTNIFDIYNIFKKDNFAFVYRGIFSNNILNLTTDLIQNSEEFKQTGVQNKLSYLTIETFQNVIRYSETSQMSRDCSDLFIFRRIQDDFFITTANLINKEKTSKIEKYLVKLNSLTLNELKQLYLEILTNQSFTDKGGAGLGFIEMIRKSRNRLRYRFVPYNVQYNYFYFQIQVNVRRKVPDFDLPISQSVEINQIARKLRALLIQKTNFTPKTIEPVIQIVRHNIRTSKFPMQKRIFSVLVELLQDLVEYTALLGEKREAVLILGKIQNKFYILVGSLLKNDIFETKIKRITEYTSMSKDELEKVYYDKLLAPETPESDLRTLKILLSGTNYQYLSTQFDDNYTFFTQKIEIED